MPGIDLQLNLGGDYMDSDVAVEHGDFAILGGKFRMIPEDDLPRQVGQRLHVRLLLRRGEVFFNNVAGFPYADLGKFKRGSGLFDMYMKSYIVATDGVDKMQNFSSTLDNRTRTQSVRFGVLLGNGATFNSTQEFEV